MHTHTHTKICNHCHAAGGRAEPMPAGGRARGRILERVKFSTGNLFNFVFQGKWGGLSKVTNTN